jgi:DNA-binding transcriptional MerR regulator
MITETPTAEPDSLTLDELSEAVARELEASGLAGGHRDRRVSAVPDARTIRYYTTLGLLDRPGIEGRQARYGRRHVLQLMAIKALQSASLPLSEIQARLYGRTDGELEALLEQLKERGEQRPEVRLVRWREVTIEPGLKVMADENWAPGANRAALEERIRAAIGALTRPPGRDGERRKEHS